jgi:hypothetical protein
MSMPGGEELVYLLSILTGVVVGIVVIWITLRRHLWGAAITVILYVAFALGQIGFYPVLSTSLYFAWLTSFLLYLIVRSKREVHRQQSDSLPGLDWPEEGKL